MPVRWIRMIGAYFVVVLVLTVAVETLVDPFAALLGVLQKKISPEEMTKDLQEWLPGQDSQKKASGSCHHPLYESI
jgi:hypothetical protein